MVRFFLTSDQQIYAVDLATELQPYDINKLQWLFGGASLLDKTAISGHFTGPRKEMVSPWSTNAVEICQNMGIASIRRIERFLPTASGEAFDHMLEAEYTALDQDIFSIDLEPAPVKTIAHIGDYNKAEGLALSDKEISFLEQVSASLGRGLTDCEVYGFSQVNSEHCRHKIFNGAFIINQEEKADSLFALIKKTARENPNRLVSAYKDNVAFIKGPMIEQFAPVRNDVPDYFCTTPFQSIISLKAETHNFPTTVEPFNGAATGSGGEIRDRLAGGKGSLPLAGTAVYFTAYPRLDQEREWEHHFHEREWLYQRPEEILIKASDGASDFGNKFGQPLICGSVLTFEHMEGDHHYGFDKVIMLAGGVGFGKETDGIKEPLEKDDQVVLLGGDNYRIGMGGAAVSSVSTGQLGNALELNAVQRSNPEMQKRVMNVIRAMAESAQNPVKSIHDHGAGGHLNCFSELLEDTGGTLFIDELPKGDPTLSDKEMISNESQERMGLALREKDLAALKAIAERERAPLYTVGVATDDNRLVFENREKKAKPVDIAMEHLFGSSPKLMIKDQSIAMNFGQVAFDETQFAHYIEQVVRLEGVACKDWLTNKVDRSVTGKVAVQQTCGPLQLPLNNVAVMALDYTSQTGVATGIGHAPGPTLIDAAKGSRLAIAEALLNIIWAPLTYGLKGISLSANWMWPTKQAGENARLYQAVEAVSDFAIALGINIPTGKDSLSMTQQYPNGNVVHAPGTVIITAVGEVSDIRKSVTTDLKPELGSSLIYVDFSTDKYHLGGSAFAQVLGNIGQQCPDIADIPHFIKAFDAIQDLIGQGAILAGHDVSSGGLVTNLLEMCFPLQEYGISIKHQALVEKPCTVGFCEKPAIVIQVRNGKQILEGLTSAGIHACLLGEVIKERQMVMGNSSLDIDAIRNTWFHTSYLFDRLQRPEGHAKRRQENIFKQPLSYIFPSSFKGTYKANGLQPLKRTGHEPKAAIIREKGVNGDREMAYALYLAGFAVKDVHMTDLVSGRETLSDIHMIVFVGGFSNSDVLGSAKGWAGAFLYNDKAREALNNFYDRDDTLSLGVCNGCQLMMELGLIYRHMERDQHPRMHHNASGKFESTFSLLTIPENDTVMFSSLQGTQLGAWVAHGEGKFVLDSTRAPHVAATYHYDAYPGNPNGSDLDAAALSSPDGRHLAIMPHIERSIFPWNWPYYPDRPDDEVTPWIIAFINARNWIAKR